MSDNKTIIYKVKVNDFEFGLTQEDVDKTDIIQRSQNEVNLLKDHRSTNAVLIAEDQSAKKQTIEIDGERFHIQIKDELDIRMDEMGFNKPAAKQLGHIKAPMPGLVLEIGVREGDQVNEGDKILILVAMKMENSITAQANATIKNIAVRVGDAVEKGQLLVELNSE